MQVCEHCGKRFIGETCPYCGAQAWETVDMGDFIYQKMSDAGHEPIGKLPKHLRKAE
jgi:hypothetical protein